MEANHLGHDSTAHGTVPNPICYLGATSLIQGFKNLPSPISFLPLVGRWFAISYLACIQKTTHNFDCFFSWPTYAVGLLSFSYFPFFIFFIVHISFSILHFVFSSVFFLCTLGLNFPLASSAILMPSLSRWCILN